MLFSMTSPVLFAGSSNGIVSVLRLTNAGCPSDLSAEVDEVDPLAESDRLQAAVAANIKKGGEAGEGGVGVDTSSMLASRMVQNR